jgi:hypothetical protein
MMWLILLGYLVELVFPPRGCLVDERGTRYLCSVLASANLASFQNDQESRKVA